MKTKTEIETVKANALQLFLGCADIGEAQKLINEGNYLVLDDNEATEKAKEYILDSLWAFNYNFLCGHSKAINEIPKKEYEEMAGKLCESFNKAVHAMIDDIDYFIEDAIRADGRGHFLSGYDGEENEILVSKKAYYIYRIN